MTSIQLPAVRSPALHLMAQRIGLGLTAVLLVGLLGWPQVTLHVLWDMVIPLLPAVFLVNPLLWRNVCPLATVNTLATRPTASRRIAAMQPAAAVVGIVLLALMVPARRFLFNTDGPVLAASVVGVIGLAALGGVLFPRRSGFCNAVCPVLPVEKLYGQFPLVRTGTARCGDCTVCTPTGCIELAADKTVAQTLGPRRRDARWLLTSYGVFATAFPGFIIGYFTTTNGALSSAGGTYLHVAIWAAASYAIGAALVTLTRMHARVAMPVLGAVSIATYYWFAAPALTTAYGLPAGAGNAARVLFFSLIAVWAWRAWSRVRAVTL